jgi:hypothetical protein
MTRWLRRASILIAVAATLPGGVRGQLLSPGKLASAHAELEGLRNCTSCHQLGKSGIQAERCLTCHQALNSRVSAHLGFHASVSDACADCHKEHLGTDFNLVRLDTSSFDHARVGYTLEGSHAGVQCRDCHKASNVKNPAVLSLSREPGALDRTYLGLSSDCAGCHSGDSPHGPPFAGQACSNCHDTGRWNAPSSFDHGATTFPLEGEHAQVACAKCHGTGDSARFASLPHAKCNDCHADPHSGAMRGACTSCHNTGGWHALSQGSLEGGFDHSRMSFQLRGAHATLACAACHRTGRPPSSELVQITYRPGTASRAYPSPVAETCASCHVDRHTATTAARRWVRCADCHTEAVWAPSSFGIARHADSSFPLTGAHAATACTGCHQSSTDSSGRFVLAVAGRACADCHASESPHGDRYVGQACESCHTTEAFEEVAFDHAARVQPGETCTGCHSADNPHGDQFAGQECSSCHRTDRFTIDAFDHATTRFPLDGAHSKAQCVQCHVTEGTGDQALVRYRPLGTECLDCHKS